jgi:hypothetical protein
MALPQLLMPDGTPPFFRDTHEIELISLYGNTPMQTGAAVKRRLWRSTPRYASVMLELDVTQMAAFDTWFEDTLKVGAEFFSAQIQNQGPGLLWWKCRFFEPYSTEYLGGIWWRLSARLLLDGDGSVSAPEPTGLVGAVEIHLLGSATVIATQPISGSVTVALLQNTAISDLTGGVEILLEPAAYALPPSVASAAGAATVLGVGNSSRGAGAAAGVTVATGAGRSAAESPGSAVGLATVTGIGNSSRGTGSAAGTSTASGIAVSGSSLLLEDGASYLLLEDGTSRLLLE